MLNIYVSVVPVLPDDTPEILHARIKIKEHRILPQAITWVIPIFYEAATASASPHLDNADAASPSQTPARTAGVFDDSFQSAL